MDCPRDQYNVDLIGAPGGGGEYDVQLGFGWTNGVALRFLNDFGDQLKAPSVTPETLQEAEVTSGAPGTTLGHKEVFVSCYFLLYVIILSAN